MSYLAVGAGEWTTLAAGPADVLLDRVSAKMPRVTSYPTVPSLALVEAVLSILNGVYGELNKIERIFSSGEEGGAPMRFFFPAYYDNTTRVQRNIGGYILTFTALRAKLKTSARLTAVPGFKDAVQKALIEANAVSAAVSEMKKDAPIKNSLATIAVDDSIRAFAKGAASAVDDIAKLLLALPQIVTDAQDKFKEATDWVMWGGIASAIGAAFYFMRKKAR